MRSSSRSVAVVLCISAASGAALGQARRVTPPQEVASFDDLRPKTLDQIVRSTAWSGGGGGKRLTGTETVRIRVFPHPVMEPRPQPTEADPYQLRYLVCTTSVVLGK